MEFSAPRNSAAARIDLDCPHCDRRPVATAAKLRRLRGWLLFATRGHYYVIGCDECVQSKAQTEALLTLLLGWWCFPWGLWTPVVVVQNLLALAGGRDADMLCEALAHAGIRMSDVQVGSDGMTGSQRQLTAAFAQIVGRIVLEADRDGPEWSMACDAVIAMSGGAVDRATAERWVRELGAERPATGQVGRESVIESEVDRLTVLRIAIEVALADGQLSAAEGAALRDIAGSLRIPLDVLEEMLASMATGNSTESGATAAAYRTLGVEPGASTTEIQSAYRQRMVHCHPDLVPPAEREEATRRASELNHARDTLVAA